MPSSEETILCIYGSPAEREHIVARLQDHFERYPIRAIARYFPEALPEFLLAEEQQNYAEIQRGIRPNTPAYDMLRNPPALNRLVDDLLSAIPDARRKSTRALA